ncbi:hypothetical protein RRG08_007844 [Elysia crispata]|uniref:Uncharacterized protein n=1 Tax=Elysia crispata TaxID=231223 RepID=A0AAE1CNI2_9GAST|nr:hypothetical protein RRG08_007844 [Elysia crispata]
MKRFVQPAMKALHHFIVTPMRGDAWNADLTHVRNFVPMQSVLDMNGQSRVHSKYGFTLTKPMDHEDLMTTSVSKWVTPAPAMQAMDHSIRKTVNVIKGFVNVIGTAMFLHDTTTASKANRHCNFRKHSHLHILIQSTKAYCRDLPKFRSMEHTLRQNEVELFTSTAKCTPQSLLHYMTSDPEKSYLGSNLAELRVAIKRLYDDAAEAVDASMMLSSPSVPSMMLENEPDKVSSHVPQGSKRKRQDEKDVSDNDDSDDEDDDDEEELIIAIHDDHEEATNICTTKKNEYTNNKSINECLRQPPMKKQKRSKNLLMLDQLNAVMLKNPHCATFPELVAASRGTDDYDNIANCYLDARSEKTLGPG